MFWGCRDGIKLLEETRKVECLRRQSISLRVSDIQVLPKWLSTGFLTVEVTREYVIADQPSDTCGQGEIECPWQKQIH